MDLNRFTWRKSSYSEDDGGDCVEVAQFPGAVGVRDSKDPQGPELLLSRRAFRELVHKITSAGE
jgi:hypothetical protein